MSAISPLVDRLVEWRRRREPPRRASIDGWWYFPETQEYLMECPICGDLMDPSYNGFRAHMPTCHPPTRVTRRVTSRIPRTSNGP